MSQYLNKILTPSFYLTVIPILTTFFIAGLAAKGFLGRCDALPFISVSLAIAPLLVFVAFLMTIMGKKEHIVQRVILIVTQAAFILACATFWMRNIHSFL